MRTLLADPSASRNLTKSFDLDNSTCELLVVAFGAFVVLKLVPFPSDGLYEGEKET